MSTSLSHAEILKKFKEQELTEALVDEEVRNLREQNALLRQIVAQMEQNTAKDQEQIVLLRTLADLRLESITMLEAAMNETHAAMREWARR